MEETGYISNKQLVQIAIWLVQIAISHVQIVCPGTSRIAYMSR